LILYLCLTVTLLNNHESKRSKKGGFRFWACMPIYNRDAALNMGHSDEWVKRRDAEVHREAMHILVEQIRQACRPRAWLFADRQTRMAVARLAYFIGDQPAQEKLLCKLTQACSVCWAPADQFDCTDRTWPQAFSAGAK